MSESADRSPVTSTIDFDDGLTAEQRAAAWIAQVEAIRAKMPTGSMDRSLVGTSSGLAMMQDQVAGKTPLAPFGDLMNMFLVEVSPGRAVFQGLAERRFYNLIGTIHGGVFATMLDSAVGCAVHTGLPAGQGYTTLELKVNFLRTLTDRVGPIRAEGRLLHISRQVAVADGRMYDAAGKLYAHATTTCLVFPIPAAT